jgi:m7GpppX diphosphatase
MINFNLLQKLNIRNEVNNYINYIVFSSFSNINFTNYNLYLGSININKQIFSLLITDANEPIYNIVPNNIVQINIYNNIYTNNFDKIINKINNFSYIKTNSIKIYINDNYNKYIIFFPISIDIIEWIRADIKIFNETINDYNNISLPYINSIYNKNTKWIHNLLLTRTEQHLLLYNCNDFIITKDIHWKNNNNNNFYILAIPYKNIKSIRDLNANDITLLENIKAKSIEIANMYGISHDKLYMFFHYHPSYYHLHLHVCIIDHYALETKYYKHYLLNDIIDKLKINSDHWKSSTLTFELLSTNKLYNLLESYQKIN